ncbi:MAG: universal stress protein, partial [Mariprofundaceae bacterium]
MTAQASVAVTDESKAVDTSLYRRLLIALDSSDHANAAMLSALALAELTDNSTITGTHAYAAQLHDVRFRQMEGGLPEQFREEQELERQRDVHDDLIGRGLSIITDCYLDQAERDSLKTDVSFVRSSLEGKNYRVLTEETNSGKHELLVMGSLGLGAVEGSRLGTVCQRVARRSEIDTLIIKNPEQSIKDGPIVAAIDGSEKSYGGLITAMSLARAWNVELKVVSAFDPYFHYVAFNRIADVLSDEAGKVFRFKEQEKLHEEIIDSGLATIYQGHLDVAKTIADELGVSIETVLLDGKPHAAIEKYLHQVKASLLVIGKLGIHADSELDIGGNAENLLYNVDCAVLLGQREYTPKLDVVADVTTSW